MFIRFVVRERDADSNEPKGIFQAVADLRDRGELGEAHLAWADEVVACFNRQLPRPDNFRESKRHNARNRGISWFRVEAKLHVGQARCSARSWSRTESSSTGCVRTSPGTCFTKTSSRS